MRAGMPDSTRKVQTRSRGDVMTANLAPGARPSRTASAVRDLVSVFVLEKVGFSLRSNLQSAEGEACDLPLPDVVIYVPGQRSTQPQSAYGDGSGFTHSIPLRRGGSQRPGRNHRRPLSIRRRPGSARPLAVRVGVLGGREARLHGAKTGLDSLRRKKKRCEGRRAGGTLARGRPPPR